VPTRELLDSVEAAVAGAVRVTLSEVQSDEAETEPSVTDRLAARIKDRLALIPGVDASVRTLRDRGRGAAEKEFGADLLVVVKVHDDGDTVTKGLFAQAKWDQDGLSIDAADPPGGEQPVMVRAVSDNLRKQCVDMLRVSDESVVLLYGTDEAVTVRASAVIAPSAIGTRLPGAPLPGLIRSMAECTRGDTAIGDVTSATLRQVLQDRSVRTGLLVDVQ
jgi:hypothetical protein